MHEEVGRFPRAAEWFGAIHAAAGHDEQARQELWTLTTLSQQQYVPDSAFAMIHAELGEYDAAFARMDKALEAREGVLVFLAVSRGSTRFARTHASTICYAESGWRTCRNLRRASIRSAR